MAPKTAFYLKNILKLEQEYFIEMLGKFIIFSYLMFHSSSWFWGGDAMCLICIVAQYLFEIMISFYHEYIQPSLFQNKRLWVLWASIDLNELGIKLLLSFLLMQLLPKEISLFCSRYSHKSTLHFSFRQQLKIPSFGFHMLLEDIDRIL